MSFNPYLYVLDNPVNLIDPSGHEALINWMIANQKWLAIGGITVLGIGIAEEYICEGQEAASAVPSAVPSPYPVVQRPAPPVAGNGAPRAPCTILHVGQAPQGPPELGPPYWPSARPGGGPPGPPTGPGE
jgi:hypothetical protein